MRKAQLDIIYDDHKISLIDIVRRINKFRTVEVVFIEGK